MAELALQRSEDPRVRRFAGWMIDFSRRFDADLGFGRSDEPVDLRELACLRGPDFDVAYLRSAMDAHDAIRPDFADYKRQSGGRLHRLLAEDWDELVELREQAKPLHDEIRNAARGRSRHWRYEPDS